MTDIIRPTLAVVVPLHNKAAHVARALSSILRQTRPADEIIVIDDASSDGGAKIAAETGGSHVRLLHRAQPGPGGYAARNLGIKEAGSEWIAFLDADDEWDENHLATFEAAILREKNRPLVMVGTAFRERYPQDIWRNDIVTEKAPAKSYRRLNAEGFLKLWLRIDECPVWTSAIAAKRQALIDVGLFPQDRCRRGGDKDLWLRLAMAGSVVLEPAQTATYYKDADNMVTLVRSANQRHCLCGSVPELADGQSTEVQNLLSKLHDLEVYKYSLRTIKSERLHRETWTGFKAWRSPVKAALLMAATSWAGHSMLRFGIRALKR